MTAPHPRRERSLRTLRAVLILVVLLAAPTLTSCASSPRAVSLRILAVNGWEAVENPVDARETAEALERLADRLPPGLPGSGDGAIEGSRPGLHLGASSTGTPETVLRVGSDPKEARDPREPGSAAADLAPTTATLARRVSGAAGWSVIEIAATDAHGVLQAAAAVRPDLPRLAGLGPRALDAVRRAAALASTERGIPASAFLLEGLEEVTWPNSALGVPRAGMVYAMALVPGHRITLRIPGGLPIVVHTSSREAVVAPTPPPEASR